MSPLVGCPGPGELLSGGAFVRGVFCPGALLAGETFGRGCFCPGGRFPRGSFARGTFGRGLLAGVFFVWGSFARGTCPGAYARSPQVQCIYAPSRLSVPSVVA